jgi:nucleoside-diphosphate-sugar epimerase
MRLWCASPRAAVGFLVHAAGLDLARLGPRRSLTMPGVSATVGEEIDALRRTAGDAAVRLIRRQADEMSARIVGGWPVRFDARRAVALGFAAEASFDEIIRVYLEDDYVAAVA